MAWDDYVNTGESPSENEGLLKTLWQAGMTPIALLAQTLDKPGRALRGLLAGRPEELLNLIPFSDTLNITDPTKATSGRDLGRQWGWMDQADSTENFWGGLGLEMLLDPTSAMTFGTKNSLSALGKADALKGALAGTAGERIAAKQAGLAGVRTPWWYDMTLGKLGAPTGSMAIAPGVGEGVANLGGNLLDKATKLPVIGKPIDYLSGVLQSAFQYGAGHTGDRRYSSVAANAVPEAEKTLEAQLMGGALPMVNKQNELMQVLEEMGTPRSTAEDALKYAFNAHREGTPSALPPRMWNDLPGNSAHLIDQYAREMAAVPFYETARDTLRSMGKKIGEEANPWGLEYAHQRSGDAGRNVYSQQTGRTIDRDILPRGSNQFDELVNDFAGAARAKQAGQQLDPETIKQLLEGKAQDIAQTAITAREARIAKIDPATHAALQAGEPIDELARKAAGLAPLTPDPSILPLLGMTNESITGKARSLAQYIGDLDPALKEAKRGFYRPDPAGNAVEYALNLAKQGGTVEGVLQTLAKHAQPYAKATADLTDAGQVVNLKKALNDLDLNASIPANGSIYSGKEGGIQALLDRLGTQGKHVTDLEEMGVTRDLIDTLTKELAGPKAGRATGLEAGIDKALASFRSHVTVPFLPYHLRNNLDALVQQGLGGGLSGKALKEAGQFRAGAIKDPALASELRQYAEEAFVHNAAFRDQALELLGKGVSGAEKRAIAPFPAQGAGSVGGSVTDWLKNFKGKEGEKFFTLDPQKSTIVQRGVEAHMAGDQTNRFAQFIGLRRQGYEPAAAAELVRKSQLDYTRLTPFERNVMRRVMPFYSFSKQNLGRLSDQLGDPGAIGSLIRTMTEAQGDTTLPGYVTPSGAALPIGQGEDGKQRYLSGLGLPIEDEVLGGLISALSGRPGEGARRAASAVDPLTKLLIESATDTQLYSGRKLSEMQPSSASTLGGVLPDSAGRVLNQVVSATPLARLLSNVDKAAGVTEKPEALLQLLTGARVSNVDKPQAENVAARKALMELLMQTGQVGKRTDVFLKPEYKDNAPPETAAMLKILRDLEDENRTRRKREGVYQGTAR